MNDFPDIYIQFKSLFVYSRTTIVAVPNSQKRNKTFSYSEIPNDEINVTLMQIIV